MKLTNTPAIKLIQSLAFLKWLMMLAIFLMPMMSLASPIPAYTVIKNQATVVYFNDTLDIYERVDSNIVEVEVVAVPAFTFSNNEVVQAAIGQEVTISHILTNTGNVPLNLNINWNSGSGSNFNLMNFAVYVDSNNNGVADPNDRQIVAGNNLPTLAVGESYLILVVGDVPNTATVNSRSLFSLTAAGVGTLNETVSSHTVNDQVNVTDTAGLRLFKSANVVKATPSREIIFTILATQASGSDTQTAFLDIDGVNQSKVFIRDAIPAQTRLTSVDTTNNAQVLYHVASAPTDNYYTSTPPANLNEVDAIAFAWDSFPSGASRQVTFTVTVLASINENVINQAVAYQTVNGNQVQTKSNTVVLPSSQAGGIYFYQDDTFTFTQKAGSQDEPLYIGAPIAGCNTDPTKVESYYITLSSEQAGDKEEGFIAVETGPNTGFFTIIVPTDKWEDGGAVTYNNSILTEKRDDNVNVRINCGGQSYSNTLIIDSSGRTTGITLSGVVFNSKNYPQVVPGAKVNIYTTDAPIDGTVRAVGSLSATKTLVGSSVTNTLGRYMVEEIDLNADTNLEIEVISSNYTYPSNSVASAFTTYKVEVSASYGKVFRTTGTTGGYTVDIPLDPISKTENELLIEKTANKDHIRIGETITYTINYSNASTSATHLSIKLSDLLPRGFAYVSGSAKRTITSLPASFNASLPLTTSLPDPVGAPGRQLTFNIGQYTSSSNTWSYPTNGGTVSPAEKGTITYTVQVRSSAPLGKATNLAELYNPNNSTVSSNTSSATVYVNGGVFSDEAFVLGTIYADCNNNKQKDPDEPGIPFVRMYLEDGTYVISDGEGRFSLYGLTPRTHVMKIDQTTLPQGAKLEVLNNRFAHDAHSSFVDLKKGELHRTDFAIKNCSAKVMAEIQKRRGTWKSDEVGEQLQSISDSSMSHFEPYNPGDLKARPASGMIKTDGQVTSESIALPGTNAMASHLDDEIADPNKPKKMQFADIQEVFDRVDNRVGFIDLHDCQVLPAPQVTVRVKGVLGAKFRLSVNDKVISNSRVGKRSKLESKKIEAWDYIGVNLRPGNNKLEISIVDNFGNRRESQTIHVIAPGKLDHIELQPVRQGVADGITPLPVVVRLVDKNGNKIFGLSKVRLETTAGRWDVADFKPNPKGGIDVFVENGEGIFNLLTNEPGKLTIRASSGMAKKVKNIHMSADLRPLIAVGVIEGAVGLRDLKDGSIEGISNSDNFERSIRTAFGGEGDAGSVGLRGAMFLKGKVKGDYLLTLAYDSDKHMKNEMFRDIDPNKYYPVYGDDSVRGFDAQATSDLYVRVDKGNSYILYGDYSTQDSALSGMSVVKGKSLGAYQRNMTGLKGQYEGDMVRVTYFAAYEDNRQVVTEFSGRGISGPYDVSLGSFVHNSEKISILTRSKSQPSLILYREQLSRFADYNFDAFNTSILFSRPIPSTDENGNPVSIEISYEVESGGEKFWVYGGEGDVKISDMVSVGGSYVEDKNPLTKYRLSSVHSVFEITPNIGMAIEWAKSEGYKGGANKDAASIGEFQSGNAYRFEMIAATDDKDLESRVYMTKAETTFENSNGGVSAGQDDAGVIVNYRITESTALHGEGLYTKDKSKASTSGSERYGTLFSVEQSLSTSFATRLGTRFVREKSDNQTFSPADITSLFGRLIWSPDSLPELRTFVEGEMAIAGDSGHMLAAGAEYSVTKDISLYGRHEFVSELGLGSTNSVNGQFGLSGNAFDSNKNATTLGVKYNYASNSNIFSEYRIANALDGRQAEGSMGVNHGWEIAEGLRMNTTFERIQPFSSKNNNGIASAATLGFDYTAPENWKGTTRFEWRRSKNTQSWLHTVGWAYKLNKDWTTLVSNIFGYETQLDKTDNSGDRKRDDARIGMAYRDTDTNKLNALMRYQLLLDDNDKESTDSLSHVLTGLANYQLNPDLILSGRYAISRTNNRDSGIDTRITNQLVMGRFTYDLSQNWDIGVMASRLFGDGARQMGYGAEVGYLVGQNIWFSVGYNFIGFRDDKLTGSDYTQEGGYIRLRIKFDENMFSWLTE